MDPLIYAEEKRRANTASRFYPDQIVRHREYMRATPEQLHEMLTYCMSSFHFLINLPRTDGIGGDDDKDRMTLLNSFVDLL